MALPPKIRTAVVLYYIEGYSVDETAYMMRLPAGTVKSRLHKGRKMLKDTLGDTDIQEKRKFMRNEDWNNISATLPRSFIKV